MFMYSVSLFIAINLRFNIQDCVKTDIYNPSNNDGYLRFSSRKFYPKRTAFPHWCYIASIERNPKQTANALLL